MKYYARIFCIAACSLLSYTSIYTIKARTLHQYTLANYHQFKGNYDQAKELYQELHDGPPSTHYYKGYIPLLFAQKNYQEIINRLPELDPLFKQDSDMQLLFAYALEKVGRTQDAATRLIALHDQFKSNQEIAFKVAQLYLERKELENALAVIDTVLNNSPSRTNNFIFYFVKAQIYVFLNNKSQALKNVKACLRLYPVFDKGWLLFALLQEQSGNLSHAVHGYVNFLTNTSTPLKEIERHVIELAFKQKLMKSVHKTAAISKDCLEYAIMLFDKRKYRTALRTIDRCLNNSPDDDQAKVLKLQILTSSKKYDEVVRALKSYIQQDPEKQLWYDTLHALMRNGLGNSRAIALLAQIVKERPTALWATLYLGDLYVRTNQLSKSHPLLSKAVELIKDNDQLKVRVLYQQAVVYYQQKNYKTMKETLERAQLLPVRYPPVFNLLAYYYLAKEKQYDSAHTYIAKALDLDPGNVHFVDTKAMLHYKQEHYDQAFALLEPLAHAGCDDHIILRHFAKTCYKLNKHEQSAQALRSALRIASTADEKKRVQSLMAQWSIQ